jgi:hypothetical protein
VFFREKEPEEIKYRAVVVGKSPEALFLADCLRRSRTAVTMLCAPSVHRKLPTTENFVIKSGNFQNRQIAFEICDMLPSKPDFCFLASLPDEAKQDLFLLNNPFLSGVTVFNLSVLHNRSLLSLMNRQNIVPLYLNGGLSVEHNVLTLKSRYFELETSGDKNVEDVLKTLFQETELKILRREDGQSLYWIHAVVTFVERILTLALGTDMSAVLQNKDGLAQLRQVVEEIDALFQSHKMSLDKAEVLMRLYASTVEQKPMLSAKVFNDLLLLLPKIDYLQYPCLFRLMSAALNKY